MHNYIVVSTKAGQDLLRSGLTRGAPRIYNIYFSSESPVVRWCRMLRNGHSSRFPWRLGSDTPASRAKETPVPALIHLSLPILLYFSSRFGRGTHSGPGAGPPGSPSQDGRSLNSRLWLSLQTEQTLAFPPRPRASFAHRKRDV